MPMQPPLTPSPRHRQAIGALALALVGAGLLATVAARADETSVVVGAAPPAQDTVLMTLSAEEWAATDTARVMLVIDAGGGNAGSARTEVGKAAQSVSDKGEWHVQQFDRQQDQAGLDHWQAVLEARLPESQLGGLADRARQASRPGLQVRIGQIDFTPTLAEQQATFARLRARLYQQAAAEAKALSAAFPGREYRVAVVRFDAMGAANNRPRPMIAHPIAKMASEMTSDSGEMSVGQQLRLLANVTLQAYAPPPPKP